MAVKGELDGAGEYTDPMEALTRDSRALARALTILGSYADGLRPPASREELEARAPLLDTVREIKRMLRERPDAIAVATALGSMIDDTGLIEPAREVDHGKPLVLATLRLSVASGGAEIAIHEEVYRMGQSLSMKFEGIANEVISRVRLALSGVAREKADRIADACLVTYHPVAQRPAERVGRVLVGKG